MLFKWIKYGVVAAAGTLLLGGLMFGSDLMSYMRSSANSVRQSVKDQVPVEFELKRARDLIDNIIPELQANIRLIAQEEVEIAALENDIAESQTTLDNQHRKIARLRDQLETQTVSYSNGRKASRDDMTRQLSQRFARCKEADVILTGKQRLLETKQKSLAAAHNMLEKARNQKRELEQKVESLVAQHRLVKASSIGSRIHIDSSQLTKADKLLAEIQTRLSVAQRVLEHETALFDYDVEEPYLSEDELFSEVDDYLGERAHLQMAQVDRESD